ncbi:MAG: YbaB/EbfC family nucleoid-associated protein [Gordonia sp. (in: high G+C Gram-positive bacteria)]|uniref:YbaB/EbfC family nucleoid-associated protein n=1 Tax=Gordonia sp. (in: high G+C Gram-positive bacteria) TaxID=84139 RepID=UPI003BB59935
MTDAFDGAAFDGAAFDPAQLDVAAQRMQQQLIRAQEMITAAQLAGSAAGGLVVVTGNGIGDVTGLTIAPTLPRDDVDALSAMILEALADLAIKRRAFTEQVMGPLNEPPANDDFGLAVDDLPRTADGLIDLG